MAWCVLFGWGGGTERDAYALEKYGRPLPEFDKDKGDQNGTQTERGVDES